MSLLKSCVLIREQVGTADAPHDLGMTAVDLDRIESLRLSPDGYCVVRLQSGEAVGSYDLDAERLVRAVFGHEIAPAFRSAKQPTEPA